MKRLLIVLALLACARVAAAVRVDGAWTIKLDGCFVVEGGGSQCGIAELALTVVQNGNQLSGTILAPGDTFPPDCTTTCLPETPTPCQYKTILTGTVSGNAVEFEVVTGRHIQAICNGCVFQETFSDRLTGSGTVTGRKLTGTWTERLSAPCTASASECSNLLTCSRGDGYGNLEITLPPLGPCYGDCGADHAVSAADVVTLINHALESSAGCALADTNSDGVIAVDDAVRAASTAVDGCQ